MSIEGIDQIVVDIQTNLDESACKSSKASIFKVDNHLRIGGWDSVYDPKIVAIGPYHRGKPHLQNMEKLKHRYLKRFLNRPKEEINRCITAVAAMEERVRECYAEPTDSISKSDFVKMMVIDGCFLIELIRNYALERLRDEDDPIFRHGKIRSQLRHDIFLLENQLPFFLLNELFNMTKIHHQKDDIITLTLQFAGSVFLNFKVPDTVRRVPTNIDHIFGLLHLFWCLPFAESISARAKHRKSYVSDNWANINSISGLREAGIKIEKAKEKTSLMDITLKNGVLRIPWFRISDETESYLRNLITYEQYLSDGEPRYVSDFTLFMHCLIKTSDDVKFLRCRGIIENWFGEDEKVCSMFNRMGKNILTSYDFSYSQIFQDVNKQCSRRRNKWGATLRRNYFNSPWSIISFLAAATLLLLTLLQTVYAVLSYKHRAT
ncbi:hypothetical protein CDL12_13974 [Handroanthus impetiginosus]|uniref:Uncharacterized protein n=1 Tax=Handroanthus impetiginosus TaxID=429701 RepID=A0A2G9H7B3_9LAMI|nr:hypothetical protein CDL12_13974 [Handroanthus impetiginosus]